jgi:hypothetical protein
MGTLALDFGLAMLPHAIYGRNLHPQEDRMQSIDKLHDTGWQKFDRMPAQSPIGATVHRSLPSEHQFADTAAGARDFYRKHPDCHKAFNDSLPFHLVITPVGEITQTAPLDRALWHAKDLNKTHLGICCIGDFRVTDMPAMQRAALVSVCAGLIHGSHGTITAEEFIGHTERPEGSAHPEYDSPGKQVSMPELRRDIATLAKQHINYDFAWASEAF